MKELAGLVMIISFIAAIVVGCGDDGDYWGDYNREGIESCRELGGKPVMRSYYRENVYTECILP